MRPLQIFYAEDDQDDVDFFLEALQSTGVAYEFTHHANGFELMNHLAHVNVYPDIIFLDINMPLKSGYECLKEIRSNTALSSLNVTILSTSTSAELIENMFRAGATGYAVKPFNYRDWPSVLKAAIARNQHTPVTRNNFVIQPEAGVGY